MPQHPKFKGQFISESEHQECVKRFGSKYSRLIEPTLKDTKLFSRGRWHKSPDAPCLYIFRSMDLYESDSRGLFLHIQETSVPNGIEIVFRKTSKFSPLEDDDWDLLEPEKWQPSNQRWRAFIIKSVSGIKSAKVLLSRAIKRYDEYYEFIDKSSHEVVSENLISELHNTYEKIDSFSDIQISDKTIELETHEEYLSCPYCSKTYSYKIYTKENEHDLICKYCKRDFILRICKIRSKRSRYNKSTDFREFDIRVKFKDGSEYFIQFKAFRLATNLEMSSGDEMIFIFDEYDEFVYYKNITINDYFNIKGWRGINPSTCYISTHIFGPNAFETNLLRKIRDTYLLKTNFGQTINNCYLLISPIIISTLGHYKIFNITCKFLLDRFIKIYNYLKCTNR